MAHVFGGIRYSLEHNVFHENFVPNHTLLSSLEQVHHVTLAHIYDDTSDSKFIEHTYHTKFR
jgi:hypothetical protein